MKGLHFILMIILWSCTTTQYDYSFIIAEEGYVNTDFLQTIQPPEKALLSWYLYAYGNECGSNVSKIKCKLLKEMHIENECDTQHLNNLLQWFSNDMLAVYKLNKCPNLPVRSPIQNTIDKITLSRSSDTLSITIKVRGQNESQEKAWDIEQTAHYLIRRNYLKKIDETGNRLP